MVYLAAGGRTWSPQKNFGRTMYTNSMEQGDEVVDCDGVRFKSVYYQFDCTGTDRELIQSILEEAEERAENVNPAQANTSQTREKERRVWNNAQGVLAEYVWQDWLNTYADENGVAASIESREDWDSPEEEVDLTVVFDTAGEKTIEVRSSCGYANFENLVCEYFDIMGWYTNAVKQGEKKKDYYARVVYPFASSDSESEFKSDSLKVYLTGGATREMLEESPHATTKTMNKDSDTSKSKGSYRAIEPIHNGLDMDEFPGEMFS